jgi:hypothetical protein
MAPSGTSTTAAIAFGTGALAGALAGAAALHWLSRSSSLPLPGGARPKSAGGRAAAVGSGAAAAAAAAVPGQQRVLQTLEDFADDDILSEQLTRNVQFFGLRAQKVIARSFVVVVGLGVGARRRRGVLGWGVGWGGVGTRLACGGSAAANGRLTAQPAPSAQGVGSHAAHMLLRSGVGRLRLVDFDQVTLSSLNRHAVAVRADVGTSKAACLQRHFAEILPEVGPALGRGLTGCMPDWGR